MVNANEGIDVPRHRDVRNAARYLPDFLASLERQTIDITDLDIIFVDDGSTDESGTLVKDWIHTTAPAARLFTKPNGGAGSARNLGLHYITNQWVTFCDPDDTFPTNY